MIFYIHVQKHKNIRPLVLSYVHAVGYLKKRSKAAKK